MDANGFSHMTIIFFGHMMLLVVFKPGDYFPPGVQGSKGNLLRGKPMPSLMLAEDDEHSTLQTLQLFEDYSPLSANPGVADPGAPLTFKFVEDHSPLSGGQPYRDPTLQLVADYPHAENHSEETDAAPTMSFTEDYPPVSVHPPEPDAMHMFHAVRDYKFAHAEDEDQDTAQA